MELLAAVDLRGGGAVRLVQGDFDREQAYGDPLTLARRYLEAGARWLHVVDLDAARTGTPVNRPIVRSIAALAADRGASVEASGGVRTEADLAELLGAGVDRVVLGTAAVADPGLARRAAERFPGRVALGLDYRRRPDGTLEPAVRGWLEGSGGSVRELLEKVAGAPLGAIVVTAIERDGTLEGPDVEGLEAVLGWTEVGVVASGGVGSLADLHRLSTLRGPGDRQLLGVIAGRALADGRVDVKEGVAACAVSG
jgi:phosphoribosylformimino-5-aminoimidazole carboxamide ribotide isomerase